MLPSWDRKSVPYPFSKLIIEFGEPIYVRDQSFEAFKNKLSKEL
jgi:lysophospholipid acyltransferase (LPLAT)-like uncharacterized protein